MADMQIKWINPRPIEAGEAIIPAKLASSKARDFAAMHLVIGDMTYASATFGKADELGLPNDSDIVSKSLIHAGVIAYGRCFTTGVRSVRLRADDLLAAGAPFDREIHDYLLALRDKHVAHSVNEFERCEAIAVVIGRPGETVREGGGVGAIIQRPVGISRKLLRLALAHVAALRDHLQSRLDHEGLHLYEEFRLAFEATGKWEWAALAHFPDRADIAKARPQVAKK